MKNCPFCAEEIQDQAIVCKHCGRNLQSMTAGNKADKKPWIGFLGLILLVIGGIGAIAGSSFMSIIALIGLFILIIALATGNIKFFGN